MADSFRDSRISEKDTPIPQKFAYNKTKSEEFLYQKQGTVKHNTLLLQFNYYAANNSTSKIKSALGGITAPAPREP